MTNTPMIYVRPANSSASSILNGHGIEGRFTTGQRVLLIDDLISGGGSVFETIATLESAGLIVKEVVVLVDREQGAAAKLRHRGYDLLAIVSLHVMITNYVNTGRIDDEQFNRCMAYLDHLPT
jgi:orotate phosphoribosyltransferase/uridine monophosphate synthetase